MNNQNKQIIIWASVFIVLITLFNILQGNNITGRSEQLAFSDFLNKVEGHQINSVKIQGKYLNGTTSDGRYFTTYAPDYPGLIDKLNANNIHIDAEPPDTRMNSILSIFISWFPMLLLIGVWVFFMRQMNGGAKGMGFGKSKAKLVSDKGPKVTFADVAGVDEAKEELEEIVDFLRNPRKFQNLGGKIPKGCLLMGPPGTGKTLLAKAISGEANVPFFSISGSSFVEMFVGVGASRVRDMFEQGKKNAPCIIFIDEIDAVGRHRGIGLGGGNDEREQTLNQMLVEMDGFESNEGVVIIAATNRPDVLDSALLRPGRFDRQITVSNPDINGREQILKVHSKKIKLSDKVDLRVIARGTPGFSGADLQNLVNESALLAARHGKTTVDIHDLDNAKDKVLMGAERRSMAMTKDDKKMTAYHEAGHALVSLHFSASDPIHKATIIPRGRSLGMVQALPERDQNSFTRAQMIAKIAMGLGGRIAEEIIYGANGVTSGASQDIKMVTNIAESMVTEWGLSEKIGPIFHGKNNEDKYSGSQKQGRSQKTLETIEEEMRVIIDNCYVLAKKILVDNIDQLHLLARTLIEKETLSGKQIKHLLLGNPIDSEDIPVFPIQQKTPKSNEKIT